MDGSTVSLAWGIQLETIPLLFAIECYEQSASARLFFSLLHLRARSSTLSFSSSSRRTIASLPPEIVNKILDQLFLALLPDARDAIIKSESRCDCQREYSTQHTCGVDCSSWFYCCPPDDEFQPEGDWNRMKTFRTKLHHFHIPKITTFLRHFHLELITPPTLPGYTFFLSNVVVGIPFIVAPPPPPSSSSFDSDDETESNSSFAGSLSLIRNPDSSSPWNSSQVSSVARGSPPFELTSEEQKLLFKRFAQALHLVGSQLEFEELKSLVVVKSTEGLDKFALHATTFGELA